MNLPDVFYIAEKTDCRGLLRAEGHAGSQKIIAYASSMEMNDTTEKALKLQGRIWTIRGCNETVHRNACNHGMGHRGWTEPPNHFVCDGDDHAYTPVAPVADLRGALMHMMGNRYLQVGCKEVAYLVFRKGLTQYD